MYFINFDFDLNSSRAVQAIAYSASPLIPGSACSHPKTSIIRHTYILVFTMHYAFHIRPRRYYLLLNAINIKI